MGFNRRKMEDKRREAAEKEAATRRATDAQVLEDAERLITAWNERQAKRMPMIFSPTIGAAIPARYWFLWVHCPACRTINAIDLRTLDRHHDAAVTSLVPALSCRSCRPHAPFAELVRLSRKSIADEMREEHRRQVLGAPAAIDDVIGQIPIHHIGKIVKLVKELCFPFSETTTQRLELWLLVLRLYGVALPQCFAEFFAELLGFWLIGLTPKRERRQSGYHDQSG